MSAGVVLLPGDALVQCATNANSFIAVTDQIKDGIKPLLREFVHISTPQPNKPAPPFGASSKDSPLNYVNEPKRDLRCI